MYPPRHISSWVSDSGIITGIYTTSSPEACQYIAYDCRANIIVVDTQKQLEKILKVWGKEGSSHGGQARHPHRPPPSLPESPTILNSNPPRHMHTSAQQGNGR